MEDNKTIDDNKIVQVCAVCGKKYMVKTEFPKWRCPNCKAINTLGKDFSMPEQDVEPASEEQPQIQYAPRRKQSIAQQSDTSEDGDEQSAAPARQQRPQRTEKPERPKRAERHERPQKPERPERPKKPERPQKPKQERPKRPRQQDVDQDFSDTLDNTVERSSGFFNSLVCDDPVTFSDWFKVFISMIIPIWPLIFIILVLVKPEASRVKKNWILASIVVSLLMAIVVGLIAAVAGRSALGLVLGSMS